jgi:protein TonB
LETDRLVPLEGPRAKAMASASISLRFIAASPHEEPKADQTPGLKPFVLPQFHLNDSAMAPDLNQMMPLERTEVAPDSIQKPTQALPGENMAQKTPAPLEPTPPAAVPAHALAQTQEAQEAVEWPQSDARYLNNPRPAYPAWSRRMQEQGVVWLRVHILADGLPDAVLVHHSSGFARLDEAAQQAVTRWRFIPGKKAGVPHPMWVMVPLEFRLHA